MARIRKISDAQVESKRTVVPIFRVGRFGTEHVMTDGDGKEPVAGVEVRSHSTLHRGLQARDRKTERDGDIVDDLLERLAVFNGREENWPVTGRGLGDCFAICDVDFGDIETVEVGANIFGYVERSGSGESTGHYTHPDGRIGGVTVAVFDRHDGSHGVVVEIFFIVVVVLVLLDLLVLLLVEPGESNKVDTCGFDTLCVE